MNCNFFKKSLIVSVLKVWFLMTIFFFIITKRVALPHLTTISQQLMKKIKKLDDSW